MPCMFCFDRSTSTAALPPPLLQPLHLSSQLHAAAAAALRHGIGPTAQTSAEAMSTAAQALATRAPQHWKQTDHVYGYMFQMLLLITVPGIRQHLGFWLKAQMLAGMGCRDWAAAWAMDVPLAVHLVGCPDDPLSMMQTPCRSMQYALYPA